jgi:hypothetical protein
MKRTDRILIEVTVGELRDWLRGLHPDLPEDFVIESRTLTPPDVNVCGQIYDSQNAFVAMSSKVVES